MLFRSVVNVIDVLFVTFDRTVFLEEIFGGYDDRHHTLRLSELKDKSCAVGASVLTLTIIIGKELSFSLSDLESFSSEFYA